ncbi:hypothetical protein [Burkholderia thailandensis]|uniref:hypothetical protein n=1 Tax=Burkholderia thailandensis TaxID=57975 RepID=UPI001C926330|nr:hypothetical protein [Burkholderia thailandensis]
MRSEDRPLTSSAHTYRLFIVKEHICEKTFLLNFAFSAALRCQQQRNEIMITYSQRVNNFFYYRVAQRLDHRFTLSVATTADRTTRAVKLPASPSRCVLRSAKEA